MTENLLVLFLSMNPGPDAYAMSGQAAGVRNNGPVGVRVRKVR